MFCWVSAHITDADGQPVFHAENAQLRYRVLFEELDDKLLGKAQSQEVACRPEVFFCHGLREVEYEHQVADDASLERRGVAEQSVARHG